jgi:hypothetical protein
MRQQQSSARFERGDAAPFRPFGPALTASEFYLTVHQAAEGSVIARDILAGLFTVRGTGVGVWMIALGLPAWSVAGPFLISLVGMWLLAMETFR